MQILIIPASLRADSFNRKLAHLAAEVAKKNGATVEVIDLRAFPMPAYDGDIEASTGLPEPTKALKSKIAQATALMVVSPEYNFSYPGHFKNTFDWLSRPKPDVWKDKPVLFMSASPSLVGGNRGLWALRVPFESCGSFVFPEMFSLSGAPKALEGGQLSDPSQAKRLETTVTSFLRFVKGLAS